MFQRIESQRSNLKMEKTFYDLSAISLKGKEIQMFSKIEVNGENEHPIYTWLKSQKNGKGTFGNAIKWNFTKFLLDREGNVTGRFGSVTTPEKLEAKIVELL